MCKRGRGATDNTNEDSAQLQSQLIFSTLGRRETSLRIETQRSSCKEGCPGTLVWGYFGITQPHVGPTLYGL